MQRRVVGVRILAASPVEDAAAHMGRSDGDGGRYTSGVFPRQRGMVNA
jgi:hypothetical protein